MLSNHALYEKCRLLEFLNQYYNTATMLSNAAVLCCCRYVGQVKDTSHQLLAKKLNKIGWGRECTFDSGKLESQSVKYAKNIIVRSKLCASSETLSTVKNTTSNLLRLLIQQHSEAKLVEKEWEKKKKTAVADNKASTAREAACTPKYRSLHSS